MRRKVAIATVTLAIAAASVYGLYRYYFPLGIDHHCDTLVWFALREYAEKHNGAFPSGEATPEASISLIHSLDTFGGENAYLLRRRDVSEELVRDVLKRGELLGPETCGWNYVEGLRIDSNPKLALFWDKEGLGHNGQRLSGGGHIVLFVNGNREHIPAAQWDRFLEEQQRLRAEEGRKQHSKKSPENIGQPQGPPPADQPGG